jgi:aminopeptidase N
VEERVLELKAARQTFTFEGLAEEAGEPVLSVLRGFSAPVTLQMPYALCRMPYAWVKLCSRSSGAVLFFLVKW